MPIIPAHWSLRLTQQYCHEFESSLGFTVISWPAWTSDILSGKKKKLQITLFALWANAGEKNV